MDDPNLERLKQEQQKQFQQQFARQNRVVVRRDTTHPMQQQESICFVGGVQQMSRSSGE